MIHMIGTCLSWRGFRTKPTVFWNSWEPKPKRPNREVLDALLCESGEFSFDTVSTWSYIKFSSITYYDMRTIFSPLLELISPCQSPTSHIGYTWDLSTSIKHWNPLLSSRAFWGVTWLGSTHFSHGIKVKCTSGTFVPGAWLIGCVRCPHFVPFCST